MSTRLDLSRPRTLGELLDTTFALQRRWFAVFFTVTAVVNVPFVILVEGIWQRQLRDGPNAQGSTAAQIAAAFLAPVVIPALVTALHVRIVQGLAEGTEPHVGRSLRMLPPVALPAMAASLLYVAGIFIGLVCLIVPGLIVAVRWYFAPQAAVYDGARGFAAVEASRRLVRGRSWEVFGRVLAMGLIVGVLVSVPEQVVRSAVHEGWISIAVVAVIGTAGASLSALFGTLLFFSLRADPVTVDRTTS